MMVSDFEFTTLEFFIVKVMKLLVEIIKANGAEKCAAIFLFHLHYTNYLKLLFY